MWLFTAVTVWQPSNSSNLHAICQLEFSYFTTSYRPA